MTTDGPHPDAGLIEQARRALANLERNPCGTTSSLTGGGVIAALERAFSASLDGRFALAMPSGTAALRVALGALGVGSGDEVICQVYDWPAALAAIRSLGAEPVFAECDAATLTIDPSDAVSRVADRTKAVVATHLFGIPADVAELVELLTPLNVPVIEDCAQALGARLDGQPVGSYGAAATFSFGPNKLIDAGEGGLVAFKEKRHYDAAVRSSQHPLRQTVAGLPDVRLDGLQLRIHPLAALLTLDALPDLPSRISAGRAHAAAVHEHVAELLTVGPVGLDERREPSWYRVPVIASAPIDQISSLVLAPAGVTLLNDDRLADSSARIRPADIFTAELSSAAAEEARPG